MFNMAMLQVRDMDNRLYDTIRYSAKKLTDQSVNRLLQSFKNIFHLAKYFLSSSR